MAGVIKPNCNNSATLRWSERLVYFALGDPVRRRIFLRLAHGTPLAASQLRHTVNRSLDATYKQLVELRAAGWVIMKQDPTDVRRTLWELVAGVPIKITPTGKVIDFGFIRVRVK